MSLRKTPFASGEYYHLYNRGNSKQEIFNDEEDYQRFVALLYTCNSENNFRMFLVKECSEKDPYLWERGSQIFSIGAYCLMPNHFHLLVTEKEDGGISKFIQKLSTAYVMYHNIKYEMTGVLFEGKFKSEHLDTDEYLKSIYITTGTQVIQILRVLKEKKALFWIGRLILIACRQLKILKEKHSTV